MGSGSTPLLPGSSVRVGRRHAAQFALVAFAGAAVICSVYLAARPVVLAQFDGHVQRERSEWDALDSGFIERRPLARAPAAFSLLRAVDHTMSLARAEQEDSKPMVRKAWSKVDRIVGLMDAEDDSEFTALQQLAKSKKKSSRRKKKSTKEKSRKSEKKEEKKEKKEEKKEKKEEKKEKKEEKKETKKEEKKENKEEKKGDADDKAKIQKSVGAGGVLEDASIHNDGFYLAGNTLKAGSNVVIYGTGSKVEHSGGGVANSGAVGPGGGSGGGGGGKKAEGGKKKSTGKKK